MQEIIKTIESIIKQLQQAKILDLILAVAAFLSTLLILQFFYRFFNRRYDITPIRRSLRLIVFLIALMVFLIVMGSIEFLRILNSGVFFMIILLAIKIADYVLVEQYLINRRKFHITRLPRDTIKGIIFIILFLIMLRSFFGISLSGIGITAAVATGVLGFALQDTLSSVIAGISISIEKPFRVGDWIKVNSLEGRVEQINWRTTRLRTFNDDYVILPNYTISRTELINFYTPTKAHAREISIGVSYDHPPERVKAALLEAATGIDSILDSPSPLVRLTAYGDFSITYTTKFWIKDFRLYPDTENSFRSKVWYIFKRNGITIPFPIHDVRIAEPKQHTPFPLAIQASELADIDILKDIPAKDRKIIASHLTRRLYGREEILFRKGDPGDYLYFINSGTVRLVTERATRVYIERGGLFGEMSMITGEGRSATLITETECELFLLHRNELKQVFKKHPEITRKLVSLIEKRQMMLQSESATDTSAEGTTDEDTRPRSLLRSFRKYLGL